MILAGDIGGTSPRLALVDAVGDGISALAPDDLVLLNDAAGRPASNRAILSAGTGLGEAGLYWDGTMHRAIASEGVETLRVFVSCLGAEAKLAGGRHG